MFFTLPIAPHLGLAAPVVGPPPPPPSGGGGVGGAGFFWAINAAPYLGAGFEQIVPEEPLQIGKRGGRLIVRRVARKRTHTTELARREPPSKNQKKRPNYAAAEIERLEREVYRLTRALEQSQGPPQPSLVSAARALLIQQAALEARQTRARDVAYVREYWARFNALVKAKIGDV